MFLFHNVASFVKFKNVNVKDKSFLEAVSMLFGFWLMSCENLPTKYKKSYKMPKPLFKNLIDFFFGKTHYCHSKTIIYRIIFCVIF